MATIEQRITQLEAHHEKLHSGPVILLVTQGNEDERAVIARWEAENERAIPENAFLIMLVSL